MPESPAAKVRILMVVMVMVKMLMVMVMVMELNLAVIEALNLFMSSLLYQRVLLLR